MNAVALVADDSDLEGHVEIVVRSDGSGGSFYPTLRSSGALAVRATIDGVSLVGASAHPIGGDRLRVDIEVGPDARLSVQSASATLARGSNPAVASRMEFAALVKKGGALHWAPEPGIAAHESTHVCDTAVSLGSTSSLCWCDAIVLGRFGEDAGSWESRLRVEVEGLPLVVSALAMGSAHPAWSSPAVLGGARCSHNITVVEPGRQAPFPITLANSGYVVPLSECALQIVTWGSTFLESRAALRSLLANPLLSEWMDGSLGRVSIDLS
ncbi:MAG: urease accessory protein UreD [Acidimicrobiales bacterium]|jgi:urease accessory protein